MSTYALEVRSARCSGRIELSVKTLNSAIALGRQWAGELGRVQWQVNVMDETGTVVWRNA